MQDNKSVISAFRAAGDASAAEGSTSPESPSGGCSGIARFSVYDYKGCLDDRSAVNHSFIVLKTESGLCFFTGLEIYAMLSGHKRARSIGAGSHSRCVRITCFLNDLQKDHPLPMELAGPWQLKAEDLTALTNRVQQWLDGLIASITWEKMDAFFHRYAAGLGQNGRFPCQSTADSCISCVCTFVDALLRLYPARESMRITTDELFTAASSVGDGGREYVFRKPLFSVQCGNQGGQIFRDMPTAAFVLLLELALHHAPDIAFAIGIQAFAGLREGEVLEVRQENSPLGPGLIICQENGEVTGITIDISRPFALRDDGSSTGVQKVCRIQQVYKAFRGIFMALYRKHLAFLAAHEPLPSSRPMFINRRGEAMSYDNYCDRFQALVRDHFIPALLDSSDPALRLYGMMVSQKGLACHALRHLFTLQLVLAGESAAVIQSLRGDKSPQTANWYLRNKQELVGSYKDSQTLLIRMLDQLGRELRETNGGEH